MDTKFTTWTKESIFNVAFLTKKWQQQWNIRKRQCIRFILFVIIFSALSSCSKDEIGRGETMTSFATVYTEGGQPSSFVKPYTLVPDGGGSMMYITKTSINKKELTHQQRVIATYTFLKNVTPQNLADLSLWNIRLDQIMDLTCKLPVLKSQSGDPDLLGTGGLRINNIQFTVRYLNIEYEHSGGTPSINLWFDDSNHPASATWITSLCIDTPPTATEARIKGYISFDVLTLFEETRDYLRMMPDKLILRYNESVNEQKELRYTIRYDTHWMGLIPE
jgi:hypothetical protein